MNSGVERVGADAARAGETAHLSFSRVTRFYRSTSGKAPFHALGPVSFELFPGEFFSVVGPSGCGKSTLLDVAAGLSPPTEGEVRFEGGAVNGVVPDGVALVFQEDA
ncbi:MAG: ATP-binding cassette domain-containing protein, partial [Burkholderiaceae bacterium]